MLKHVAAFVILLGGCAASRAVGTNPGDMSVAGHQEECVRHKAQADAYRAEEKRLDGGKGTYTAQVNARKHDRIAAQHDEAARALDPTARPCR